MEFYEWVIYELIRIISCYGDLRTFSLHFSGCAEIVGGQ